MKAVETLPAARSEPGLAEDRAGPHRALMFAAEPRAHGGGRGRCSAPGPIPRRGTCGRTACSTTPRASGILIRGRSEGRRVQARKSPRWCSARVRPIPTAATGRGVTAGRCTSRAARTGRVDVARVLLTHKAEVDAVDVAGETALRRAVANPAELDLAKLADRAWAPT